MILQPGSRVFTMQNGKPVYLGTIPEPENVHPDQGMFFLENVPVELEAHRVSDATIIPYLDHN